MLRTAAFQHRPHKIQLVGSPMPEFDACIGQPGPLLRAPCKPQIGGRRIHRPGDKSNVASLFAQEMGSQVEAGKKVVNCNQIQSAAFREFADVAVQENDRHPVMHEPLDSARLTASRTG